MSSSSTTLRGSTGVRAIGCAALALLLVASIGFAALRVYVVRLRHKGERLQMQARTLKPGVSTLQDVRQLIKVSGLPYVYDGSCDESECYLSIGASSFYFGKRGFWGGLFDNGVTRMFGVRLADYRAMVDVANGVVTRVRYGVFYRTSAGWLMSAGTIILDKFEDPSLCSNQAFRNHHDFVIESGQSFPPEAKVPHGDYIVVGITPRATADQWKSAQMLDLTCVTGVSRCKVSDLMPLAYRDWKRDLETPPSTNNPTLAGTCEVLVEHGERPIHWWASRGRIKP